MRIFLLSSLLFALAVLGFACSGTSGNSGSSSIAGGDSPTEAYKRLFAAVKSKNTEAIKQEVTKTTQEFAVMLMDRQKQTADQVYENGFTATTFADKLPEIRDERINGNNGAVEVWNSKEKRWEDLPFVKEDSKWKLAVGDLFKGTWTLPGKSRSVREQEAANAAGAGPQFVPAPNINIPSNANVSRPGPVNSNANASVKR